MTRKKFWVQGLLLTGFSFFFRMTNIGYRSYLSGQIGAVGMGLYQLIFSVFMLAVTLSTSGLSLAVTRMVTAAIAAGRRETIRSVVTKCLCFCLTLSSLIALLFLFCSDFAATVILGNPAAAPCLRILAFGLPFMSLCTCMKGYFLAVDASLCTSVSDAIEQVLTIASTVFFFWYFAPQSIEVACLAAMLASSLGEAVSFVASWVLYRRSLRKNTPKVRGESRGVVRSMFHIAIPCTLSAAAKNLLSTAENLLIPRQLQLYGLSQQAAMAAYGLLCGMTMPMLFFPSSFLTGFASLLIPPVAAALEQGNRQRVQRLTQQALDATLSFGIFCAVLFYAFGEACGAVFYHQPDAGKSLQLLSPIVPLLYLDVVVDNLLKGLDEQLHSMKYNFFDALLRVVLILLTMRFWGMRGYTAILFCSAICNAMLSLRRLLRVTKVRIPLFPAVFLPLLFAVASVCAAQAVCHVLTLSPVVRLFVGILLSILFYCGCFRIFRTKKGRFPKKPSQWDPSNLEISP